MAGKLDSEGKVNKSKNESQYKGIENGPEKVGAKGPGNAKAQEATGKMKMGGK